MKKNRTSYKEKLNINAKATQVDSKEYGVSGISISMGKPKEDVLKILMGPKRISLIEEMVKFDPTVGASDSLISSIASGVSFSIKPKQVPEDSTAKIKKQAQKQADLISSILFEDLNHPFKNIIQNGLTATRYGFALLEPVYKIRDGKNSIFNDGLIGLKKVAPRYQGSIHKWLYDENKDLIGVQQQDPNTFEYLDIPIDKLIHIKYRGINDSPIGQTLYFNCAKAYYYKKNIEEMEMIRAERGFDGFVEITGPSKWFNSSSKDPNVIAMQKWMDETIQNVRNGSNVGAAHPDFLKIDIKSAGNGNMPDMDTMINRYDKDIAKALLSDFFLVQQKSGNSAGFTSSKIKTFTNLVKEILDEICSTLNHKLIPDLISKNLMDLTLCPELTHTEISDLDLTNMMLFFQSFQKGFIPPSAELANMFLRKIFGDDAPTVTQEQVDDMILRNEVTTVSNDDGTLAGESAATSGSKEVKKNQDVAIQK